MIKEANHSRLVLRGSRLQRSGMTAAGDLPERLWLTGIGEVDAIETLVIEPVHRADEHDGPRRDAGDEVTEVRGW